MAIEFSGGSVTNRARAGDPPLVVTNGEARTQAWRDFRDGLTLAEQAFFELATLQDGRGRVGLSAAGAANQAACQADPGGCGVHEHVRLLLNATVNANETFHVMPLPVFQRLPAGLEWVTAIVVRNNPERFSMRVTVNGYGGFPAEWIGFEVAGRTHRATRRTQDDACVYATRFAGQPLAVPVTASWNTPTNRSRQVGRLRGDNLQVWVDREGCVSLFHELIHHVIRGVPGHGNYDTWVERRARNNWNSNHGAGP